MASTLTFAPRLPAAADAGWMMAAASPAPEQPPLVSSTAGRGADAARGRALRVAAVYRRRRLLVGLALVIAGALAGTIAASAAGLGARAAAGPTGAEVAEAPVVLTHVVAPGDTLWSIAATFGTGGDIRATVDKLAAQNGGSVIQVGQRLSLAE